MSAVFAAAREVADAAGLELRLPEVSLREQRKCSFVEEGSAFVSWQGEISPCYFLWHRFSCFASGWSQSVQPKVFGTLAEQNILEIWNSKEFLEFRCEVLAYDYPTCASCSLAPCDYVQTEKFEQDCHIRSVPCGFLPLVHGCIPVPEIAGIFPSCPPAGETYPATAPPPEHSGYENPVVTPLVISRDTPRWYCPRLVRK